MHPTKEKIALLNDKARKGMLPGSTKMMLTRMVAALPEDTLAHLLGVPNAGTILAAWFSGSTFATLSNNITGRLAVRLSVLAPS